MLISVANQTDEILKAYRLPEKQQRITIPSLLNRLRTFIDGSDGSEQSQILSNSSMSTIQMQNGLALHDRFSELATNLGYEFNKALASANDQTIDEQNFETLHKAFEKKLDSEKEIVSHQYRKQIDILKQQEDHTMGRVTELLQKVQSMNATMEEQLRLNADLK